MTNKRGKSSLEVVKYTTLSMLVIALAITNARAIAAQREHEDEVLVAELYTTDQIFMMTEVMPKFQDGDLNSFAKWVAGNINYPAAAKEAGIEGRVIVSFVVEKDGSLSTFTIVRSPNEQLCEEVIRILKTSPKWTPGMQRGETVRVKMNLPIDFKVPKE